MAAPSSPHPGRPTAALRAVVALLLALAPLVAASPAAAATAPAPQDPYQRVLRDAEFLNTELNSYWSAQLAEVYGITFDEPDRFAWYRTTADARCGGAIEVPARNAFYCREDGNEYIAFDLDWFASDLDRFPGNATTFLVLAHEWGHAVQDTWEETQPGRDVWEPRYRRELNADCLAGVFLADAVDTGRIVEEEGDAEAIYRSLFEGGSGEWYEPGDHGTSDQRRQAFTDGLRNDVAFCRRTY